MPVLAHSKYCLRAPLVAAAQKRAAENGFVFVVSEFGERDTGFSAQLERVATDRLEPLVDERVDATQKQARNRFHGAWIRAAATEPLSDAFHVGLRDVTHVIERKHERHVDRAALADELFDRLKPGLGRGHFYEEIGAIHLGLQPQPAAIVASAS